MSDITLVKFRKKANMSQLELADKLGVSQQAVAKWEAEVCFPRAELLPRLAEILGCTVDELLAKEKAPSDTEQEGGV